jgi:hypothetical protein
MKFNCGPSPADRVAARIKYLENWHRYFAWFPVRVDDPPDTCVWLQHVWRRCHYEGSWDGGDWVSWYKQEKPT